MQYLDCLLLQVDLHSDSLWKHRPSHSLEPGLPELDYLSLPLGFQHWRQMQYPEVLAVYHRGRSLRSGLDHDQPAPVRVVKGLGVAAVTVVVGVVVHQVREPGRAKWPERRERQGAEAITPHGNRVALS